MGHQQTGRSATPVPRHGEGKSLVRISRDPVIRTRTTGNYRLVQKQPALRAPHLVEKLAPTPPIRYNGPWPTGLAMKFLIIDTDYAPFLEAFYQGNPGLESSP